jgi:hypothetical protein
MRGIDSQLRQHRPSSAEPMLTPPPLLWLLSDMFRRRPTAIDQGNPIHRVNQARSGVVSPLSLPTFSPLLTMHKIRNPDFSLSGGRIRRQHKPGQPRTTLLCALLLSAACLPTAFAGDTAELRVAGRILPAPCTIALGSNGSADFGNIPLSDLPEEGMRKLSGERTLPFSIRCVPANSPILSFKDERGDSIPAKYFRTSSASGRARMFGLGRVEDKNLGMYLIHFRGIQADGKDAKLVRSQNGDAPWQFIDTGEVIFKDYKYVWSTTAQPEANSFGTINGELVVLLWPEPLELLPLQSEIKLDGSTTLVLEYP